MGKLDHAFDLVSFGWLDRHPPAILVDTDLIQNSGVPARRILFGNPGILDDLDEILARTVHDRDLDVVELDEAVVDSAAAKRRQKMFARSTLWDVFKEVPNNYDEE
jgi:hypothetical protein